MNPLTTLLKERIGGSEAFIHEAIKLPKDGNVNTEQLFDLLDRNEVFQNETIRLIVEEVRKMMRDKVRCMPLMENFVTIEEDKKHGKTFSFSVKKFEEWLLSDLDTLLAEAIKTEI